MQSDHACAGFVKVGRCCLGSILGSMLEYLLEPRGAICYFLGRSTEDVSQRQAYGSRGCLSDVSRAATTKMPAALGAHEPGIPRAAIAMMMMMMCLKKGLWKSGQEWSPFQGDSG